MLFNQRQANYAQSESVRPFAFPSAITDLSQLKFIVKDGRPDRMDLNLQTVAANHASQNVSVRQLDQAFQVVKSLKTFSR
jgi:hypothetical protein